MEGVLLVDKPRGITSQEAVAKVKKRLNVKKAGHGGTLDPLATGLLVVALGEATKIIRFLPIHEKEYEGTALLGVRTDTWDTEGKVLTKKTPENSEEEVAAVLAALQGKRKQRPPVYSAVKYQGRPLYRWARKGVEITPPEREVEIYSLELTSFCLPFVSFQVRCSAGTYIRSLCHEVGEMLGCGAVLSSLRRTRCGYCRLEDAVALENLSVGGAGYLSLGQALGNLTFLEVGEILAQGIRRGRQITAGEARNLLRPLFLKGDVLKIQTPNADLIAVVQALYDNEEINRLDDRLEVFKTLRVLAEKG